jgi:hypothetical protein
VEQLTQLADEAGISLIELALAFVIRHPAVSAAIIGPRTMAHLESQLTAADVKLGDDVLDRIDQVNPPGVTINVVDNGGCSRACSLAAGAASPARFRGPRLGPGHATQAQARFAGASDPSGGGAGW